MRLLLYFYTIVFSIIHITPQTSAFIAYDCSGPKLNITTFNTLNIDFCTPPIPSKIQKIPIIKLLQKTETTMIKYQACYITADYLITRCSSLEDAQVVKNGFFSEIIQLGAKPCADAHKTYSIKLPYGHVVEQITINQTTLYSNTIIGIVNNNGDCKGATFKTEKESWEQVIVQAKYKIQLSEGTAVANSREDIIIMPTGTRLQLSKSYGIDTHKGEVTWDHNQQQDCTTSDYDTIYEGPASLVIAKNQPNSSTEIETYVVESDKVAFALKKISTGFACNVPIIITEHPRLVILVDFIYMSYFHTKPLSHYSMDLVAYLNTKFVYVENFLKSTITSMYLDLVAKQCNLERKILLQKLSLASYSLSEFAYIMGEGPGYTALKSGEIVYLLKCKPVDVEIAKSTVCFQELPVLLNNLTYFMAPKTHTLQKYGTEIDCSDILPSAYFMEGEWFSMVPNYREIKPPQLLKPETSWTWSYKSPEHLMNTGLYTKDMMNALQRHLLFPQEVDAAQSNLARQTMGYSITDQGLKLRPFIDEDIISKMVEEKLQKMWGWFVGFGNLISGLLGIFCAWKILLICLNTILNMSILYQTFGCSIKILAGIFSGITHYVMHQTHSNNYSYTYNKEPEPTQNTTKLEHVKSKNEKTSTEPEQTTMNSITTENITSQHIYPYLPMQHYQIPRRSL